MVALLVTVEVPSTDTILGTSLQHLQWIMSGVASSDMMSYNMNVCMFSYICACTCVPMVCVCMLYVCVYMYVSMYVCVCVPMVCVCILYVCVCICMYLCMYVYVFTCYVCMYACISVHVCMYNTYTCKEVYAHLQQITHIQTHMLPENS
jgi:hypothetical protein